MSNETIGQYVQREPAGFGGLFRLPRFVGGDGVLCVTCLVDKCSAVWSADDVERRCGGRFELMLSIVLGRDEELLEDELVEHATDVLGGLSVGVPCVLGDVERDLDEFVGLGEVGVEGVQAPGRGSEFCVEAFLFGAEHVDGDRVVVVGFEELALAALDGLLRVLKLLAFGVRVSAKLLQSVPEECFEVAAEAGVRLMRS